MLIDAVRTAAASPTRPAPRRRIEDRDESGLMGADMLTGREREVLGEIGRGRSVEAISRRLGCSPGTVRKHRQNMLEKLQLNSTSQLVRLALQIGQG